MIWEYIHGLISQPCRHEWEEKSKHVFPSIQEQLLKSGRTISNIPYNSNDRKNFQSKVIIIMVCKHCGKLMKFVDIHPED